MRPTRSGGRPELEELLEEPVEPHAADGPAELAARSERFRRRAELAAWLELALSLLSERERRVLRALQRRRST